MHNNQVAWPSPRYLATTEATLIQRFSKPDLYFSRCRRLDATVTEHHIDGAPAFMRGLRAMFVSDVHVRPNTTQAELDALMDRIAAASPRLLLLGGDYSDFAEDCVRFFRALERLAFPLGAYGVLGNNDAEAWESNQKSLRKIMSQAGCKLLVNAFVDIPMAGGTLRIGGVDEYRYGNPHMTRRWSGEGNGNRYRILLSHYPVLPEERPDLMLSGHTHGGQFNLLGLTPFAIGFERSSIPHRASTAISGLHDVDGMKLLISKGIGASRLQLRVCVRPEINLLLFD